MRKVETMSQNRTRELPPDPRHPNLLSLGPSSLLVTDLLSYLEVGRSRDQERVVFEPSKGQRLHAPPLTALWSARSGCTRPPEHSGSLPPSPWPAPDHPPASCS